MATDNGHLVTRLLGRLKVNHGDGVIEFEIRNPTEIRRRGARRLLRITGLGDIPRLQDGVTIDIDALFAGNVVVRYEKTDEDISEVLADRRDNRT
jgi:hypothetical protein